MNNQTNNENYSNRTPDDSKNKDFSKEMGFNEIYKDLQKENSKGLKSDTQLKFEQKIDQLLRFQYEAFSNSLNQVDEINFIQFNSNVLKVCRAFCADINKNPFTMSEKVCMKNCGSKYVHNYKNYNESEEELLTKYGPYIFLYNKEEKDNMKNLYNMIEKERMEKMNF